MTRRPWSVDRDGRVDIHDRKVVLRARAKQEKPMGQAGRYRDGAYATNPPPTQLSTAMKYIAAIIVASIVITLLMMQH